MSSLRRHPKKQLPDRFWSVLKPRDYGFSWFMTISPSLMSPLDTPQIQHAQIQNTARNCHVKWD